MTLRYLRSALPVGAALVVTLLLGACANLLGEPTPARTGVGTSPGTAGGESFSLVTPQEYEQQSPTLGVKIEIEAPAELKALLERHLDLVRLGSIQREEVDDTEWARLIDASPLQVRQLLQTEGYFAPVVRIERAPGRATGQPDLVRLMVEPSTRARVSRVTIEVEGELERGATAGDPYAQGMLAQLRNAWELPEGADFRNPDWGDAKSTALARLRAAGYATAVWSGTGADVNVERNEVRLFLVADSGPLFRLGQLQVEGLAAQDPETVRNLAFTRRGVPVSETLLLDFQERLQKSGLFESVSVTLDPDLTKAGAADDFVLILEASLEIYTFGVGFSANTGARASVEHLYRRVFGLPASSRLKIEVGQLRQAWDAELSGRPNERLYRNLLGGAVERLVSDTDVVLSQRLRLGRAQDTQRLERLFFTEAERSSRRIKAGGRNDALALSLNFHGGWRDLDSALLPTLGETLAVQVGVGQSSGTDADRGIFGRLYGRLTVYRPLGRAWYGQARVEAGRVFLGSRMVVPDSLKWRAGGDESVRGYSFRSLGPVVDGAVGSGIVLFTSSVELARPFLDSMPSLWGAVFVDAGNAAATTKGALKPAYGAGVGVRWRSPVGPLRIDVAYGNETRKARLHFSVGIAF
ncbi:MAG: BamA/TamA family outer membrane protein [Rubrivivax sp.]|nr:BamA/TamA family outer membrane protein [Rubrivivax sp.]